MSRLHARMPGLAVAVLSAVIVFSACASGGGGRTYSRLLITSNDIRGTDYETAYEVLTHHRDLIILVDRIAFKGGDDREGRGIDMQTYTRAMLVLNGDQDLGDPITTLRQIPAVEIISIRLYRASMVPPEYRRPGAEGGVIAVRTR